MAKTKFKNTNTIENRTLSREQSKAQKKYLDTHIKKHERLLSSQNARDPKNLSTFIHEIFKAVRKHKKTEKK